MAIQNAINQMLGTAGTVSAIAQHLGNEEKKNNLQATKDVFSATQQIKDVNNQIGDMYAKESSEKADNLAKEMVDTAQELHEEFPDLGKDEIREFANIQTREAQKEYNDWQKSMVAEDGKSLDVDKYLNYRKNDLSSKLKSNKYDEAAFIAANELKNIQDTKAKLKFDKEIALKNIRSRALRKKVARTYGNENQSYGGKE